MSEVAAVTTQLGKRNASLVIAQHGVVGLSPRHPEGMSSDNSLQGEETTSNTTNNHHSKKSKSSILDNENGNEGMLHFFSFDEIVGLQSLFATMVREAKYSLSVLLPLVFSVGSVTHFFRFLCCR
jgi:hypothetical protein